MMRSWALFILFSVLISGPAAATDKGEIVREVRWAEVDLGAHLPTELVDPEGRTRWDLSELALNGQRTRSVGVDPARPGQLLVVEGERPELRLQRPDIVFLDPAGNEGAMRWLFPQRDAGLLATRDLLPIELQKTHAGETQELWIQTTRVGLGWLFLPSGPREVVLQRALILSRNDDGVYVPGELTHRWIDPRAGLVAEISGPVSADGRRRLAIDRASVVDEVVRGTTPGKLYMHQEDRPIGGDIRFGYDQERRCSEGGNLCRTTDDCGGGSDVCPEILVSILTPEAYPTIGELTCDPDGMDVCQTTSWDFSANNLTNYPGMEQVASISTDLTADETSAFGECGFTASPSRRLSREDKNFDNPNVGSAHGDWNITASVPERTGGDTSEGNIWLRAGIVNEGIGGAGFLAESRTCHDPDLEARTPVPLWRFSNQDADGWYFQQGDTWANDPPFACQQTIFAETVIFQDMLWVSACTGTAIGDLNGEQRSTVVNEGPVTLPSGHTFNAMVLQNLVEYCAYTSFFGAPSCSGVGANQVRVVLHLWEVPWIGTVVRLMSGTEAPVVEGLDRMAETDIKYGLFPPRDISVDGAGSDSVDLSWDPGLITDHIDRYRIYWDTVSGETNGGTYAFDSENHPGQVTFTGPTSATIGGLTPGQPYFFTVTSVTDYCPPNLCANNPCSPTCPSPSSGCSSVSCNVVDTVESLMFPMQAGSGGQLMPAEVSATPGGCTPTVEVTGLTMGKVGTDYEACWSLVADPCVDGYQILGADTPEAAGNFTPVIEDTGLTSCYTFDSPKSFFVVVGKGPGGTGPMGHFGQ